MCVAPKLNIQVSIRMNHSVKWEREYMSISVTQIIHIAMSRLSVSGRNPWTKSPGTECSLMIPYVEHVGTPTKISLSACF